MDSLILKQSNLGKSVFANRDFNLGEKIIEFKGRKIKKDNLPNPYDSVKDLYVQIGKSLYLGPSGRFDDFVNHSCNPNSGLKKEGNKIFLVAVKKIRKGQEITWDYSTTMNDDSWIMKCKCGAKNCRKTIKEFKHLPRNTQEKYKKLGICILD